MAGPAPGAAAGAAAPLQFGHGHRLLEAAFAAAAAATSPGRCPPSDFAGAGAAGGAGCFTATPAIGNVGDVSTARWAGGIRGRMVFESVDRRTVGLNIRAGSPTRQLPTLKGTLYRPGAPCGTCSEDERCWSCRPANRQALLPSAAARAYLDKSMAAAAAAAGVDCADTSSLQLQAAPGGIAGAGGGFE